MPQNNPLGYIIPQIIPPGAGMMGAPAAAVGIDALASLLGIQPTAMSPIAGDVVRQGAAPVQPAMAPQNNTPAARGPASANLSGYSPQELMQFARKYNPSGASPDPVRNKLVWEEIKRRQQAAR